MKKRTNVFVEFLNTIIIFLKQFSITCNFHQFSITNGLEKSVQIQEDK